MKVLVIIPVFNESEHLKYCLESFANQLYKNITWVLVNDSSTDNSKELIENFIQDKPYFKIINLVNTSQHIPGAKIVQTFYAGLESENWKQFDVLVKLDADIILPADYFQIMISELNKNPNVGIIGGLVYIKKEDLWIYENISSKKHVRGPIKTYRRECFEDIGGLRETLGWDNLDVLLAKMHGWKVKVITEVWVKHLKPTAYVYKSSKAQKLGQYFYNIGLDKKLAFISSAKAAWKDRSLNTFFISFRTFLSLDKVKKERKISPQEIAFIRKLRWDEMIKKMTK